MNMVPTMLDRVPSQLEPVAEFADILQIGARNMQNFNLLEAVGKSGRPVLLKRSMSGTIEEFLQCAEYIYNVGNERILLCERGIRTFEGSYRNTFDINAITCVMCSMSLLGHKCFKQVNHAKPL